MGTLETLQQEITRRAEVICQALALELVDVSVKSYNQTFQIQVLADLPLGGIGLEACTELNHRLDRELFEELDLGNNYTLEVSSPGLDRPLMTAGDYRRSTGRAIHFLLKEPVEGKKEWTGVVIAVRETEVIVQTKKGERLILIDHIQKGNHVIA